MGKCGVGQLPLERRRHQLVRSFLFALECHDVETRDHCLRVTRYVERLTNRYFSACYGLPDIEPPAADEMRLGALLHDIGKISVPRDILRKQGMLTEDEWAVMRTHPQLGAAKIAEFPELAPALDIVLYHHERVDGTGYPHGKYFDEIPLSARLFAVCDAFDAITSARPYRGASSIAVAQAAILRGAGTQFDCSVVEAFLSIPVREWEQLRDL